MAEGPAPRVPYRAPHTPPLSPLPIPETPSRSLRTLSVSPSRAKRDGEGEGYPESPSRGTYRRGEINGKNGPTISLDDESDNADEKKGARNGCSMFKKRRSLYIKRFLAVVLLLGVVGVLRHGWTPVKATSKGNRRRVQVTRAGAASHLNPPVEADESNADKGCQFVSVLEAYRRDLHRLRKRVAAKRNVTLTHDFAESSSSASSFANSRHRFSSTGHLLVSDQSPHTHPIPMLLQHGEDDWKELVGRQSTSLAEAVREYERRYGRRPPKGFDIWYGFAVQNGLILPDEYDRINLDLAPFFALPKDEIRRRLRMVEDMKETFTLVIKKGKVRIQDDGGLKWEGTKPRAQDAAALIGTFSNILPDMKATFSIFDQPQIYISWARRGSLVDLGLRGLHTTHLEESDVGHVELSRSCAPDSNFRTNWNFTEGKSFIYDTIEAGDMCQNPWLIPLHGLTIEPHEQDSHPRPHTQLLPLFSLAKTSINSDILITPLDQFFDPHGYDPPWEKKKSDRLAWRGSSTGISMMTKLLPWRSSHRIRLHHFANDKSLDPVSYITPDLGQEDRDHPQAGKAPSKQKGDLDTALKYSSEEVWRRVASHFFFDMKLAGEPLQCSEEDGTCEEMRKEIHWAPHQSAHRLNQHKFLLDIDGNGWSGRFRRLMSTNSVVIKTGLFTEWFQPHLIPWYMYIPGKLDFSDLADILAFFRGSPRHPDLGFDETAKAIGSNGKCFVERMFRLEDMQSYMIRLFLEYAGVDMDFYHDEGAFAAQYRMKEDSEDELEQVSVLAESDVPDRVNQAMSAFDARQGLAAAAEATEALVDETTARQEKEMEQLLQAQQADPWEEE